MAAPVLVMASRNPGKIREMRQILAGSGPGASWGWTTFRRCRRFPRKGRALPRTPPPRPGRWRGSPGSRPWRTTRAWRWRPWTAAPGSIRPATPRTAPRLRPPTTRTTGANSWRSCGTSPGRSGPGPLRLCNRPGPAGRPPLSGPGGVRRAHRSCARGDPGLRLRSGLLGGGVRGHHGPTGAGSEEPHQPPGPGPGGASRRFCRPSKKIWLDLLESRGVAQPGSAPALGAGSRRFESARPDQLFKLVRRFCRFHCSGL